jgi:hypothetical protein
MGEYGGCKNKKASEAFSLLQIADKLIYHWPIKEEDPLARQESRYSRFFPAATLE